MNEIAAQHRLSLQAGEDLERKSRFAGISWPVAGYGFLVVALLVGWLVRQEKLVNPEDGLGYWLGIVGGTLMLLLLFYPASKKSKLMQRLGLVRHWFRIHMIFGLVGPLLILYHCNFSVHAINSKVALYSMLAVAGSGIIGRYFYARIHRGLYGKRTNIEELRTEMAASIENSSGLAVILPGFVGDLHAISEELLGDKYRQTIGVGKSLLWTVKHWYIRLRLSFKIRRELQARSSESDTIRRKAPEISRKANKFAKAQVGLMRRVAQLSFYERLFSLWHVFHMPMFLLLVLSAIAHVFAVHMY